MIYDLYMLNKLFFFKIKKILNFSFSKEYEGKDSNNLAEQGNHFYKKN